MITLLASLVAAGFPGMSAPASEFGLRGFDSKGQLVYRVAASPGASDGDYPFIVVADATGAAVRKAALASDAADKPSEAGKALLAQAEPRAAGEALAKEFPELKPGDLDKVFTGPNGSRLSFSEEMKGGECVLVASWTQGARSVSAPLFRDRRPAHPHATIAQPACTESNVAAVFRADGARAAVAWNLIDEVDANRGYLAYVSLQDLASVEILDAGAGKERASAFNSSVSSAGFRVAHETKAKAKRTASAVYARKGFELEAAQVAKFAGADSVAPLDWDSCCAIVVALAK